MRYNTNNPVGPDGSSDPRDAYDNLANLDVAMTSDETTFMDRKGVTRVTYKGFEVKAESAMGEANRAAAEAAKAEQEAVRSELNADRAEVFSEAARTLADLYPTVESALSVLEEGNSFQVPSPEADEFTIVYQIVGGVAVETKRTSSAQAIKELGLEFLNEDVEGIAFSIVDESGRRTWVEVGKDGRLTKHAKKVLSEDLAFVSLDEIDSQEINEPHFSIVDEENKRSWLEFDKAGKPTKYAADSMREAMGVQTDLSSGPNIACWGDSMTAGSGGAGVTYCNVLQSLLDAAEYQGVVHNLGVGGETSVTIAARANGNPFIVEVSGGFIPSSGQVGITLRSINGQVPAPLRQGQSSLSATLKGILGTFGRTVVDGVYNYWFQRSSSGSAVTVDRPTPLYITVGEQRRKDIAIIWIGQNGPDNERAIQDAKSIIQHMQPVDKRFLVISKPGGGTSQNTDDARWFQEFGRRFIPIRQYLVEFGLQDAGITPTTQDLADISNGTVPTSLRVDGVHWNASGYQILGRIVFDRLTELGWI